MPALSIPQCGFSVGSGPEIDDGVDRIVSLGGTMRGFSNYDAAKQVFTIVFEVCTFAEATAQLALYNANRLTGGITFTAPWDGVSYTCEFTGAKPFTREYSATHCRVTLMLREQ